MTAGVLQGFKINPTLENGMYNEVAPETIDTVESRIQGAKLEMPRHKTEVYLVSNRRVVHAVKS